MDTGDIPTSVDFRDRPQARQWAAEVSTKRPCRARFFNDFCTSVRGPQRSILELGSGPGHLAREILSRCDVTEYLALDFSDAMHDLAREHLGELGRSVTFLTRDFRSLDWTVGLCELDVVVTMQAVHETRHKTRALPLLMAARSVLRPGGKLLYCDHYFETGKKPGLFLDRGEQLQVLRDAGYSRIELLRDEGGMALYAAQ